mgnify:CR=1 FL=1
MVHLLFATKYVACTFYKKRIGAFPRSMLSVGPWTAGSGPVLTLCLRCAYAVLTLCLRCAYAAKKKNWVISTRFSFHRAPDRRGWRCPFVLFTVFFRCAYAVLTFSLRAKKNGCISSPSSLTHLRSHDTKASLVSHLSLEKKN